MKTVNQKILDNLKYDYIFAGGGMAALSLAYYLNNSSLQNKLILIIDQFEKKSNDHTWCFWENGTGAFEEIVYRKWQGFWFHGTENFSKFLKIKEYEYKMLRSIDFYDFIIPKLNQNPNIHFSKEKVISVDENNVKTEANYYFSNEYIFDSILIPKFDKPQYHNLLQHFLGWNIEVKKPIFDKEKPTLFDFRIDQKTECRFVYILPETENKALVEFTIFSDNLLEKEDYQIELIKYLEDKLGLKSGDYEITETEFGVIPMSDEPIDVLPVKGIIKIGTAGGFVKPSTGYSFYRTQNYLKNLVKHLENNELNRNFANPNNWKKYLDSVLLNVMQNKRMPQDMIFTNLFEKNKADRVFKFLNEETSFWEDVKLMNTVPKLPFIKSAFKVILNKFI